MQNIPVALEAFCSRDPDENYFIWFVALALELCNACSISCGQVGGLL